MGIGFSWLKRTGRLLVLTVRTSFVRDYDAVPENKIGFIYVRTCDEDAA